MPTLVLLSGRCGHGKSTVAQYLVRRHGFVEMTLAGPLKEACQVIFGFSHEQVQDPVAKETLDPFWHVTPREVLQKVGTDLFRDRLAEILPSAASIWLRSLVRRLAHLPSDARVVVSDVRFPDEFRALHALGALSVRVSRPGYQSKATSVSHASEGALDDLALYTPDVLLMNSSHIEDLERSVETLVVPRLRAVPVL